MLEVLVSFLVCSGSNPLQFVFRVSLPQTYGQIFGQLKVLKSMDYPSYKILFSKIETSVFPKRMECLRKHTAPFTFTT